MSGCLTYSISLLMISFLTAADVAVKDILRVVLA